MGFGMRQGKKEAEAPEQRDTLYVRGHVGIMRAAGKLETASLIYNAARLESGM